MPVIEHEVHDLVKIGGNDTHRAGCWNKPRPGNGYFAPDRAYLPNGKWEDRQTFIPHRMSTECRYDQAISPAHCDGCQWLGSGKAYADSINQNGK